MVERTEKEQQVLDEHRNKVQTHDVNMEALTRARDAFMRAFHEAKKSGEAINSKLFVKFDTSHGMETLDVVEQRKHYHG